MANGRAFLALCFTVHLMFILNKISLHKDETTSENYNGLLYFKIKSSLSCIGADGSGLYWCCSRDKILRSRLGVGVKYAFNLDFNQFPESALQTALLLIAGDIAINPGPSLTTEQVSSVGMYRNTHTSSKLSVLYANTCSIVNKIDKLHLEITRNQADIVILTETHLDSTIADSEIFPSNFSVLRHDRNHHGGCFDSIQKFIQNRTP